MLRGNHVELRFSLFVLHVLRYRGESSILSALVPKMFENLAPDGANNGGKFVSAGPRSQEPLNPLPASLCQKDCSVRVGFYDLTFDRGVFWCEFWRLGL